MSKHHLRKDNICQNCGHTVPERFCTFCGQENVETRQSFGHLFRHFMEDLTHYEGSFWRTIKYLLFRPAYLTKTYLSGKRVSYVLPVKLYIFISFIAFFVPGILPQYNDATQLAASSDLIKVSRNIKYNQDTTIHIPVKEAEALNIGSNDTTLEYKAPFKSAEEYDSIQHSLPEAKRDGFIDGYFNRSFSKLNHFTAMEIKEKVTEGFVHNFPKVLFIFLPFFAFVIWLFHGKKRWLYFDHAIFSLHYFSFVLLLFTIITVFRHLVPWYLFMDTTYAAGFLGACLWLWSVYYFYRSHRKMYEERRIISFLKSTLIFFFNSMLFVFLMIGFLLYTFSHIH